MMHLIRQSRHAMILRLTCASAVFLLSIGIGGLSSYAQDPEEDSADSGAPVVSNTNNDPLTVPDDETLAARIDALIAKLDLADYAEREAATRDLIDVGPPAFAQLRSVYLSSDALELRLRIERIVHTAFLNDRVFLRNGFLGISQNPSPVLASDDRRIPDGHFGVRVERVIPNTSAADAGVQKGDVIFMLDGELLEAKGVAAAAGGAGRMTTVFSEMLRLRGPGTPLKLAILRGSDRLQLDVVLGPRPWRYYGPNQGLVYEMLEAAGRDFAEFWATRFQASADEQLENGTVQN